MITTLIRTAESGEASRGVGESQGESGVPRFAGRLTQATLRALDWLATDGFAGGRACTPRTGRHGEQAAYFSFARLGNTMIARNDSALQHRGKLDLVGWERDVLCLIELPPRSNPDLRPAEAAVDRDQRGDGKRCPRYPAPGAPFVPVVV